MHHPSPPSSPTYSENEGDEQDSSVDVAAALLDLAANNLFFSCFCGFGFLSLFDPAPTFNLPALVILILCFFFVFLWIQISVTI